LRKRGGAGVLALSLAAHLAMVGLWVTTRQDEGLVEAPPMAVQLVRPPRDVRPSPPKSPSAARPRIALRRSTTEPTPVAPLVLPVAPPKPRMLTDEELLAGPRPSLQQLRDAPISGAAVSVSSKLKACNPLADHPGEGEGPCRTPKLPALEGEGRRKEAIRSYRDNNSDYPGLKCVFLHRC
jgi:hypothetical protein